MKRIGFLILIVICISCSKEDGNLPGEVIEETVKLVATETINEERNVAYTYDEENRLRIWDETFPDLVSSLSFQYNTDGGISGWDFQDDAGSNFFMEYRYDSQGKLIGYLSDAGENVTISYQGNQIFLSGTMEGIENATIVLEVNTKGFITKMTESFQETVFRYDSQGNMFEARLFGEDGSLRTTYTMQYDTAPNPFYGQLESIYLERFVDWFWQFNGVYFGGYEGYGYCYNPNNLIKVSQDGEESITHVRTYSNDNYPVTITRDFFGNIFEYTLTYIEK